MTHKLVISKEAHEDIEDVVLYMVTEAHMIFYVNTKRF